MGGQSFHMTTQESTTSPWSVHTGPVRQASVYRPLWKDVPWRHEHPALFAIIVGSLVTAALWLLIS